MFTIDDLQAAQDVVYRQMQGKKVGVILSGGNIDTAWFARVLMGKTPTP